MQLDARLCWMAAFDLVKGSFFLIAYQYFFGDVFACVFSGKVSWEVHIKWPASSCVFPQSRSNAILPELLVDCIHKAFPPSCLQGVIQLHLAICQSLDILPAFILNIGLAQQSFIEHLDCIHAGMCSIMFLFTILLWIYWHFGFIDEVVDIPYDNCFPVYWYCSDDV